MRLGTSERWHIGYRLLTILQAVVSLLIALTGVFLKTEVPTVLSIWSLTVGFFQKKAFWIILGGTLFLWVAQVIKSYFGNPWVCEIVKSLLEELRAAVFAERSESAAHLDRVTLFKKRDTRFRFLCWPSQDWLCAVERAGHMTRRRRKWFRACDDGHRVEGVAGQTWAEGRTILKENLPIIRATSTLDELALYAKSGFVTLSSVKRQARRGTPLPRSLFGIIVEVKGKPWGVIVIDSPAEKLIGKEQIEIFYAKNAKILGKLLEKL